MLTNTLNKHYAILIDYFYLDGNGDVRYKKDGYLGRYKKDDLAKFFTHTGKYLKFQIPTIRGTLNKSALVYMLAYGQIPENMEIDHKDGNKQNDHPSNLRTVTRQINCRNRKKRSDNTSGITGINWSNTHQKYAIRRVIGDKRLSTYRSTLEEAIKVLEYYKTLDASYTERHGL